MGPSLIDCQSSHAAPSHTLLPDVLSFVCRVRWRPLYLVVAGYGGAPSPWWRPATVAPPRLGGGRLRWRPLYLVAAGYGGAPSTWWRPATVAPPLPGGGRLLHAGSYELLGHVIEHGVSTPRLTDVQMVKVLHEKEMTDAWICNHKQTPGWILRLLV